ncbi:hypothetical protein [Xenorhabdus bovienii]|uniref:hypothetical protein n=1 Tax=Xenorhabdus bovienii TaxID=40576 RepID=UPI0023B20E8A|nr:hypothetical protein [Xenorhabdus bovienii]MDE9454576.1 hypothetical protein [Xenorhabdus bovienii]MDE9568818.1 hypothetical protein [Xenorhabdus bovienii]
MSHCGLNVYSPFGGKIISVNDRFGRIVGYHTISTLNEDQNYQNTFYHPELEGIGEIFIWIDMWGVWEAAIAGDISVSGTDIIVDIAVVTGLIPYVPSIRIFYGVR